MLSCVPDDSGAVTVIFLIGADGTVGKAKIRKIDASTEAVKECVIERVRAMTFEMRSGDPCTAGPIPVTYPFRRGD